MERVAGAGGGGRETISLVRMMKELLAQGQILWKIMSHSVLTGRNLPKELMEQLEKSGSVNHEDGEY